MTENATTFGLLVGIVFLIFQAKQSKIQILNRFFRYVPAIALCYFIPSLLSLTGIHNKADNSLYQVASRVFLPLSLFLFTLGLDGKRLLALGPKSLIAFLAGTMGIVLGGPLAVWIVDSMWGLPDGLWRGLSTIAGSWIGGGANQMAMKVLFEPSPEMFTYCVTVDIIWAGLWLGFLLFMQKRNTAINKWLGTSEGQLVAIEEKKAERKLLSFEGLLWLLGPAGLALALSHLISTAIAGQVETYFPSLSNFGLTSAFFWLILLVTVLGVLASKTPLRKIENKGASDLATFFIYLLVAVIGLEMDVSQIGKIPLLMLIGAIWLFFHIATMLVVAKLFKIPFFYVAVGSQANIGGSATAPVIAAAFGKEYASIGVVLAVFGYVVGTYSAWLCAMLMRAIL